MVSELKEKRNNMIQVIHSGYRILILTSYPSGYWIPDLGVKKAPDPGSATLSKTEKFKCKNST
jgi:hypothetical protein